VPRLSTSTPAWVSNLRRVIKQEQGLGWSIREQSSKFKLARRWADGSESAAVLPLAWDRRNTSTVMAWIQSISARMDNGLSLKEAVALQATAQSLTPSPQEEAPGFDGGMDWSVVLERFGKHKTTDTGACKPESFQRSYGLSLRQLLTELKRKPLPRDARTVLGRLRDTYGGEPGSRGRRQRIQYASAALRFAVEHCGAPEAWRPPENLSSFIGKSRRSGSEDGTPIQDAQLIRLLAGIPDQRWRMAVGLCAVFGLRPVELRHITPIADDRSIYCSYVKETARGATRPGEIVGIDPIGMPGLAQELIRQLSSIPMPPLGNGSNTVASAMSTYLRRRQIWEELRQEAAIKGEHLTCYSFRHGYALRAHLVAELPPRVAAQQMRHSLQTHLRHYGRWCDAETAAATMERALAKVAQRQREAA
jgi:integrase